MVKYISDTQCRVFLGDIRWGYSSAMVGEVYEAIDVMIFVYAKPHGSILVCFSVKSKCTFRPLYVVYMVKNISDAQV